MYVVYKYRYSLYECKTNQTCRQNHKNSYQNSFREQRKYPKPNILHVQKEF